MKDRVSLPAVDVVNLTIDNCYNCPNLKTQKYYTEDSWDDCTEWLCKSSKPITESYGITSKDGRRISILDWNDKRPAIPKWCPLRKVKS